MADEPRIRRIYWDSCNFLSYINNHPVRLPILDALLAQASSDDGLVIVTSTLSVSEVAFAEAEQHRKALDPAIQTKIDALWADRSAVILIEYHEVIARRARELMRNALTKPGRLRPMDANHLATAEWAKAAEFHTYDSDLPRYAADIGRPIRQPYTKQPRLLEV